MFDRESRRSAAGLAALLLFAAAPARAGSFDFGENFSGDYKLTLNYGLGVRMESPARELIDGPIDPLRPALFPPPVGGGPQQIVGFTNTGLPTTVNLDDGNRNFKKGSFINNRLSLYGEFQTHFFQNYGAVVSGSAFYDQVFHEKNDNDSPDTVNKSRGAHNDFTDQARHVDGQRAQLLEAYLYGDWTFGDEMALDVRVGRHLTAWGESLFFPGIVSAQAPNDASKAFVPGSEIKEILLPVNQISAQLSVTNDLALMAYYQFQFQPTQIFPVGDFFSPADVVGPGAKFAIGSINPASGAGCPGLLENIPNSGGNLAPLEALCALAPGQALNAGPTINAVRGPDLLPGNSGQWGVGGKYQLTSVTNVGAYYLHYHDHNPYVKLNVGFAAFGTVAGIPITTGDFNQYVPVSYNIAYADNIQMGALSFSSTMGPFNVGGELIHRSNVDTSVQAVISGVLSPVMSRAETTSVQMSAIYASNPKLLFYDEVALVGETGYMHVDHVDKVKDSPGIDVQGSGNRLFYDRSAWAFSLLALPKGRNVISGWDLGTPTSFSWLVNGNPSVSGQFGALFGEGDMRASFGVEMQYLQNLDFAIAYNWLMGDPGKKIGHSSLPANPYADHDYATFTIKYNI